MFVSLDLTHIHTCTTVHTVSPVLLSVLNLVDFTNLCTLYTLTHCNEYVVTSSYSAP